MNTRADYADLLQRESVDVRNGAQLELWTERLDVYVADVVMAVAEVGNRSARVLEYLLERGYVGNRSRTPEPAPKVERSSE